MEKVTTFLKQFLQLLIRYTKRFGVWWRTTFQSQTLSGKIIFGGVSLIFACCLCSVPIAVLIPTSADSTEQLDEPLAEVVETYTPLPTAPPSTDTPSPTNTLPPPTDTPQPTETPPHPPGQEATVINVVDGDTIDVLIDGIEYRVRYIGMDTPEQGMPFFQEASQANANLVADQTVILVKDVSKTDSFQRLLRYVYLPDGTFVNAELVKQGYAQSATFPPDVAHQDDFLQLQEEARLAGVGLWSEQVEAPATATVILPSPTALPVEPTQPPPQPTQPPPQPTQPPPPTETQAPVVVGAQVAIVSVDKRAEFVDIRNTGDQPQDLGGWVLLSVKGNQSCSLGGVINPGETLRVWAMAEDAGQGGFNCNFGTNIWHNSEPDPAVLFNNDGAEVSRYP